MANNSENNTLNTVPRDVNEFFDDDSKSGFKFKDLVFLVLRNLHWFILCGLIGGMIAYYQVRKQEKIYASSASLLIKTAASGGSDSFRGSAVMNSISGNGLMVSSVSNEMMVLKSQTNMENMVRKLNLNTLYQYKTKVAKRNMDLYKESPVNVTFFEMDDQKLVTFSLKPLDVNHVVLDDLGEGIPPMKVKLNDTIVSPMGKMLITPTWRYQDFANTSISVCHFPLSRMATIYRNRINVTRDSEKNSILLLNLKDTSPLRAADALNTLMDVYNQESIDQLFDERYSRLRESVG